MWSAVSANGCGLCEYIPVVHRCSHPRATVFFSRLARKQGRLLPPLAAHCRWAIRDARASIGTVTENVTK